MCGRYAEFLETQDLLDALAASGPGPHLGARYNIGPTQTVRMVRTSREGGGRELVAARWGLVPPWATADAGAGRRPGAPLFNARLETVDAKPSFRRAFASRRAIVPASGYFEWRAHQGGTTPFFIHPAPDDAMHGVLAFAGIYEEHRTGNDVLLSCSILTTAARGAMADIHDRQPVMLTAANVDVWLTPDASPEQLFAAAQAPAPALVWHEVGRAVGTIRNDGPGLIEPVG